MASKTNPPATPATDARAVGSPASAETERDDGDPSDRASWKAWQRDLEKVLGPLASLKVTVALFAMGIFLVLAGTLAQWRKDIWQVVDEYFRCYFAFVEFKDLMPPSMCPMGRWPEIPGGFPFPGGWVLGGAMFVNLVAAHIVRFKVQATGTRLAAGIATIVAGIGATWLVVNGGDATAMQGAPTFEWSTLWMLCKVLLTLGCFGGGYFFTSLEPSRRTERWIAAISTALLTAATGWVWAQGDEFRLGDSSMRILWQLIQGTVASGVLLAGCVLVFEKRAGIVLLHAGILLMMSNEVIVHGLHKEGQMVVKEGDTANFVQDVRTIELAVVDRSGKDEDRHIAIPKAFLVAGKVISHAELPFDLRVDQVFQNAVLRNRAAGDKSPADKGTGLKWVAEDAPPSTGTDGASKVDSSAAYVTALKKGTTESLGGYLLSIEQSQRELDEVVEADGKSFALALRFERRYRPYSIHLKDVRFDKYLGTEMAKNYSSDIRLVDKTRAVDKEVRIWMNNPLRFAGETFYQSGYSRDPRDGAEITTLQVVNNSGWMVPYVACMIVATGMFAQFVATFGRFLRKRERLSELAGGSHAGDSLFAGPVWNIAVVLVSLAGPLAMSIPSSPREGKPDLDGFGRLPVVYEGRAKPLDTVARTTLRAISGSETVIDPDDPEKKKRVSAIVWLLDVLSNNPKFEKYEIIRIRHPDATQALDLPKRSGWRYSVEEILSAVAEPDPEDPQGRRPTKLERQAKLADADRKVKGAVFLSSEQKTYLAAHRSTQTLMTVMSGFRIPDLPDLPTAEEFNNQPNEARQKGMMFRMALQQFASQLREYKVPLAVPVKVDVDPVEGAVAAEAVKPADGKAWEWQPYSLSFSQAMVKVKLLGDKPDDATLHWNEMLVAWRNGDHKKFNENIRAYQKWLDENPLPEVNLKRVGFEAWFNRANLFNVCWGVYFAALVLALVGWLVDAKWVNRAAFWMIVTTVVVHSVALAGRVYISGRPPVTNLYSSAVFIGWGCVGLGLLFELIYRRGVGNVMGAMTGLSSLHIAYALAADGDTFTVLQAVLDTQFWLATHVVCVTLGYSTTFVAGFLGMLYILRGAFSGSLNAEASKDLSRMIYGSLCFALFFSFVGTVLGGLWADDSWGRFWGWDPKENGALIIVLWNALVLHARWGAMVKDKGMAMLAVAGNLTTAWSWFGVNELGIGLHSYGFTEGVLLTLGIFAITQTGVMLVGATLVADPSARSAKSSSNTANPAKA